MISTTRFALLLSGCLLAGNTLAASLQDGTVYGKTGTFIKQISFSDNFRIDANGVYQATLTDLKNKLAFNESSLDVKSGGNSLGSLSSPGAFSFEAGAGDYAVSLFASVTVSDQETQQIRDDVLKSEKAGGKAWWQSLSREQQKAKKAMWSSWTDEQMQAKRDELEKQTERKVMEQLASMSQGEYDIEIALLDKEVSAVPVPAAAWLFVSGLIGLTTLARRKR